LSTLITVCVGLQTFKAGVDQVVFWVFTPCLIADTLACQRKIETVLFFEKSMYTPNSTVIYGVETIG